MKVTCAAVLLLSLFVLCGIAYSAPNCGSNGVQDTYATQYCSCYSGFAPSDSTQSDCSTSAMCPAHEPVDTRTSVGGYKPYLYNTSFALDRYNVIVRVPLVVGRRNATVRFTGGANTCGYPGNLWYKKVDGLNCIDELFGSLPWSSHDMCGFKKSINGPKTTYSAVILVTYDDYISDNLGGFVRTIGVTLNVNVTFLTQVSVIYNLINLNPGVTAVTVTVVGSVTFDENTGLASVTLRTSAIWPYEVNTINIFSTPAPNTAVISQDMFFDQNAGCTNLTNSNCQQQYIMRINPTTGCNLGGNYVFNVTLVCRAGTCATPTSAGSYSVLIYNTDVCGVGGIDVGLSTGSLLPFTDAAGTMPASTFVPNQMVYFAFTLESDAVTIDSMTVEQISASTSSTTDVLYNLNALTTAPGLQVEGAAAGLAITPAITPASPGTPATLWFALQLVDAVPSFRVLPSAAATVTMNVIVDMTYHGNTKRMVLSSRSARSESDSSSQGMADIYISGTDSGDTGGDFLLGSNAATQPTTSILLVFASFAFLLLFSQF